VKLAAAGKRRIVATNAVATVLARLLVPVCNVALVTSIARLTGVAGLGQYTLLITLFQLCEQLKSLGLTTYVVREVSREPEFAASYWRSLTRIGYWGALCSSPVILAVAFSKNSLTLCAGLAGAIMCAGLLASSCVLANDAVFLALGRASYSLRIALVENVFRLLASICALVFWHSSVLELVAIYGVARFVAAVGGRIARQKLLGPMISFDDPSLTRAMLRKAPSFLTIFVAPLVFYRMDILLLGVLATDYQVGVYSAALRLISVALIVPDGIMAAMFALLSRVSASEDRDRYRRLIRGSLEVLGGTAAAVVLGVFVAGPWAVHLLFGNKFDVSTPVLQILVWGLVPIMVNRVLGDSLVADGKQSTVARIVVLSMIASAGLYIVLIKLLGMPGAAWGFVLSSMGLCAWVALESVLRFRIIDAAPVLLSLAPGVLGAAALLLRYPSLWAIGALAAAGVAALVSLMRGWNWLKPPPVPVPEPQLELEEVSTL
jgi:O-antigen/teichoic acid export membrane protein